MISLSLRYACLALAAALFGAACGDAQEVSRSGRSAAAPASAPPPASGSAHSNSANVAQARPATGTASAASGSAQPVAVVGQTARRVDPPARFAPGVQAQNNARSDAGLKALVWSTAREDEAQAIVNAASAQTCSRQLADRMSAEKDVSSYWAPPVRLLDGTGAAQDISSSFVVSEWLQERAHYNPTTGCDRKGSCENYSRIARPGAHTVGCAVAICADRSQIWACRYGD